MNSSSHNVERALVDVRRAYRLLHDYQRAALDTAKYIGAQLGVTYRDGYPRFSDPAPKKGRNALNCWAWDWLNFVHFDLNFFKPLQQGELGLSIMFFSDTGIYSGEPSESADPNHLTFASVENSKTQVGFLLFPTWNDEWDRLLYDHDALRCFLQNDGKLPDALQLGGCIAKCFNFSQMSNQSATDEVITALIQFAEGAGHHLERIKKLA
jgi:hypothetical protein